MTTNSSGGDIQAVNAVIPQYRKYSSTDKSPALMYF